MNKLTRLISTATFAVAAIGADAQYINEKLNLIANSVVSIGLVNNRLYPGVVKCPNGTRVDSRVIGTGVLVSYRDAIRGNLLVLVTARHVLFPEDARIDTIYLRFEKHRPISLCDYSGIPLALKDEKGNSIIISLPNRLVDLAAIVLPKTIISPEGNYITQSDFLSIDSCYPTQELLLAGYCGTLEGDEWNLGPLYRHGAIAWLPPNSNEYHSFIIDCEVFPGDSGGPVFLKTDVGRTKFLGVQNQMVNLGQEVDSLVNEELKPIPNLLARQSMSQGIVIHSKYVDELIRLAIILEPLIDSK